MKIYSIRDDDTHETALLFNSIKLHGSPSLVLYCIKRGEDDEDVSRGELSKRKGRSIILRIYDSLGGKSRGTIHLARTLDVKKVWRTNILEDDEIELVGRDQDLNGQLSPFDHTLYDVELRPFEVATYRLQL